jgi:hypothetical protein
VPEKVSKSERGEPQDEKNCCADSVSALSANRKPPREADLKPRVLSRFVGRRHGLFLEGLAVAYGPVDAEVGVPEDTFIQSKCG